MAKDLRIIIVNHIGTILFTIAILLALYYIGLQVVDETSLTTDYMSQLSDVIDNNTSIIYDNTILSASQVLSTIKRYYNNSDMILLLLNNRYDYNDAGYRFWITGKGGRFGQNTNYESIIISNDYRNVSNLIIEEKSINSKYKKMSLNSYTDYTQKNYINLSTKYKSVLIKCNEYKVGIAFLAI